MLKTAQLYKEKLEEESIKAWYKPENMFWSSGPGDGRIDLPEDNYDRHCFASVDDKDNVIGYIAYSVNWLSMSAYDLEIISFQKGNLGFVRDIYKAILDLFEVYHMNKIEWYCYADNPAIRGYRNFIRRHGGRECGYRRQVAKLQDGRLHDSVDFEILAEEFRR